VGGAWPARFVFSWNPSSVLHECISVDETSNGTGQVGTGYTEILSELSQTSVLFGIRATGSILPWRSILSVHDDAHDYDCTRYENSFIAW
jgi:hypothetical protein